MLWDNPHLERLFARLADEYELKERASGVTRKLRVIDETARALTDLIDTQRSMRLESHHRAADRVRDRNHVLRAVLSRQALSTAS